MKPTSFHDILMAKINEAPRPESKASLSYEKYSLESFTVYDQAPRWFKAPPKTKTQPQPPPSVQKSPVHPTPPPPAPPIENWILKTQLTDEDQSKWNLFERTLQVELGDRIHIPRVSRLFRQFLKKHHPDLNQGTESTLNFATLVKIKDEFITVLRKHDPEKRPPCSKGKVL